MTRTTVLSLACCALGMSAPALLRAQLPTALSVEARIGGALATGSFASAGEGVDAGAGYTAGLLARAALTDNVAVYAGYERAALACAACEDVSLDGSVVDAGFEAGAILTMPALVMGVAPWVRAGLVRRQLRFSDGGESVSSRPGIGFGLGAGATLPLGGSIALEPGVRFLSYPAEFEFEMVPDRSTDVSHVGFDLGLVYQF